MKIFKPITILVAAALAVAPVRGELTAEEENIASEIWTSAFAWLQTGKNLAALDQWALAIASYTESQKQFEDVVEQFPEYEPDILAYRLKKLKEIIKETEAKLEGADHEISMLYADAIEMMEKGEDLRFQVEDFKEAYRAMGEAKSILKDVVDRRPDEFAVAMKTQIDQIQSSIDWLSIELGYTKRPNAKIYPVPVPGIPGKIAMVGTTEFIKETDLPLESSEVEISSALFPNSAGPK